MAPCTGRSEPCHGGSALSSPPQSPSGSPLTMYHVPQAGPRLGHPGEQDQDPPPALLVLPLVVGGR